VRAIPRGFVIGDAGYPRSEVVLPSHEDSDFADLYAAQWYRMVQLALLLVDDMAAAEDVAQDAFVGLRRHWGSIVGPDRALRYLRTSVLNGSRSALRRRLSARKYLEMREKTQQLTGVDQDLVVAEEHAELIAAVRTLPRRQREVLVLRYWSELSEAEVATTLGVSIGTVKSTASRGIDRLEYLLGGGRQRHER
jgi:RNA polymerase sigma-70 factor (sigma-E family)